MTVSYWRDNDGDIWVKLDDRGVVVHSEKEEACGYDESWPWVVQDFGPLTEVEAPIWRTKV